MQILVFILTLFASLAHGESTEPFLYHESYSPRHKFVCSISVYDWRDREYGSLSGQWTVPSNIKKVAQVEEYCRTLSERIYSKLEPFPELAKEFGENYQNSLRVRWAYHLAEPGRSNQQTIKKRVQTETNLPHLCKVSDISRIEIGLNDIAFYTASYEDCLRGLVSIIRYRRSPDELDSLYYWLKPIDLDYQCSDESLFAMTKVPSGGFKQIPGGLPPEALNLRRELKGEVVSKSLIRVSEPFRVEVVGGNDKESPERFVDRQVFFDFNGSEVGRCERSVSLIAPKHESSPYLPPGLLSRARHDFLQAPTGSLEVSHRDSRPLLRLPSIKAEDFQLSLEGIGEVEVNRSGLVQIYRGGQCDGQNTIYIIDFYGRNNGFRIGRKSVQQSIMENLKAIVLGDLVATRRMEVFMILLDAATKFERGHATRQIVSEIERVCQRTRVIEDNSTGRVVEVGLDSVERPMTAEEMQSLLENEKLMNLLTPSQRRQFRKFLLIQIAKLTI